MIPRSLAVCLFVLLAGCSSTTSAFRLTPQLKAAQGLSPMESRDRIPLDHILMRSEDLRGEGVFALVEDIPGKTRHKFVKGTLDERAQSLVVQYSLSQDKFPKGEVLDIASLPPQDADDCHMATLTDEGLYFICFESAVVERVEEHANLDGARYLMVRRGADLKGKGITKSSYGVLVSNVAPNRLYSSPTQASIHTFVDYSGGGHLEPFRQPRPEDR